VAEQAVLLEIRGLCVNFYTKRGVVRAVRDLDLVLHKGETLALVGESGCGKSVTAHSINQLIPVPGRIDNGEVLFEGRNLLAVSEKEMRKYRGEKISMIFQEPMTSLNPVFKVGQQIADILVTHHAISRREAFRRAVELLDLVKIPTPEKRAHAYPHQLSGGMRQRVMIAMALASPAPGLLIADEPTTALDVTIQAQILELLNDLQKRIQVSILLITHDMGVVTENAERVIVMYAGRKVEEGMLADVIRKASHPYTRGLLNSLPSNPKYENARRLEAIKGTVPDMISVGEECPFANRCPYVKDICWKSFPAAREVGPGHRAWCHFAGEL
jgi:oligopeptide transport system ATP-binding protein